MRTRRRLTAAGARLMAARVIAAILATVAIAASAAAQTASAPAAASAPAQGAPQPRVRARDFGITFAGPPPGPHNAITDVPGVLVGHTTIVRGSGPLRVGQGPVRTGVTAVLPRKDIWQHGLLAATSTFNGDGEMTGVHWIRDLETITHPILLTNTGSVGAVHDAAIEYITTRKPERTWGFLPVVAETWDGTLNDVRGRHVRFADVAAAIDSAAAGPVREGNTGGGTGMICFRFKCGIGTSSRQLAAADGGYTIGVLVQANFGTREQLRIDGVPVGREITDLLPTAGPPAPANDQHEGSIIIVVATDAPLSSRQLERVAQRTMLGMARTGGTSGNTSGDIAIAFSTANLIPQQEPPRELPVRLLSTDHVEPVLRAAVDATEEAIVNALFAAETMEGANSRVVYALPYDRLTAVMTKYGRPPVKPPATPTPAGRPR